MTFRVLAVAMSCLIFGVAADAQDQIASRSTPVRVQLVISRYQNEKKVSSAPFAFVVNATELANRIEEPSRVRMGVEVPVVSSPSTGETKPNTATGQRPPVSYRPVGTNIDCFAKMLDDGRFKLSVIVEE